jgi:class 3 adenylate cyclase
MSTAATFGVSGAEALTSSQHGYVSNLWRGKSRPSPLLSQLRGPSFKRSAAGAGSAQDGDDRLCDVTGSTALGDHLDPESLRKVMASYFEAMKQVLERHGGTIEKFIGDAVMAVFGIPTLHEDDALRAVRAAVEMRAALATLNQGPERNQGVTIEVRTGG